MGLDKKFEDKALNHPQWDIIRKELCEEFDAGGWQSEKVEIAPGAYIYVGGNNASEKAKKRAEIFSELCWYINNGEGYCRSAPPHIKKYLKRLELI